VLSAAGEGDAASSGVGEAAGAGFVSVSVLVLVVEVFFVAEGEDSEVALFLVVEVEAFFSVVAVAAPVDFFAVVDVDFFVVDAWCVVVAELEPAIFSFFWAHAVMNARPSRMVIRDKTDFFIGCNWCPRRSRRLTNRSI
jgi:hypothetical protein